MRLMKGVLAAVVTAASLAVAGAQMPSPMTVQDNRPPSVKLKSPDRVLLASGCGEDDHPKSLCRGQSPKVQLTADASDPDGDRLLYNFVSELQNDPTAQGYVVCYGERRSRAAAARRRCERARTYLISTRGIEAPRVVTAYGGLRDALTLQLWLVPAGATSPR